MYLDNVNKEIAELAGIFAADGSMQKKHICFWGNPKADRDFYDYHLKELFLKAFDICIRPHEKQSNSVYGFYICNKKIISYFNEILGFPIGSKTYSLEVPKMIYQNNDKEITSAFLRGFFAGDGCLNFDKRYGKHRRILKIIHTYPRIQINCVCKKLMYQLSDMLYMLGIENFVSKKTSKKENEADSYMVQVSGKPRLTKWAELIGFSNLSHYSRYKIFLQYGFVPPNTTFEERMKILSNKLNPNSFYKKLNGRGRI